VLAALGINQFYHVMPRHQHSLSSGREWCSYIDLERFSTLYRQSVLVMPARADEDAPHDKGGIADKS